MQKIVIKFLKIILWIFWGIGIISLVTGTFQRQFVYPLHYKNIIKVNADAYGLEPSLIYGIIKAESSFKVRAKSKKGAKGLMQITDSTAGYIAEKLKVVDYDIYEPETNIHFGCWYLSYLFMRFGNKETVIVAYNAGEGNVSEWLKNDEYSLDEVNLLKIPFKETNLYLKKVLNNIDRYKKYYKMK